MFVTSVAENCDGYSDGYETQRDYKWSGKCYAVSDSIYNACRYELFNKRDLSNVRLSHLLFQAIAILKAKKQRGYTEKLKRFEIYQKCSEYFNEPGKALTKVDIFEKEVRSLSMGLLK